MTINTDGGKQILGKLANDTVILSDEGRIVEEEWKRTASLRKSVQLDEHTVMPNHFHGVLILVDEPPERKHSTTLLSGSLGAIIGQFKSRSTRRINEIRGTPGAPVWQRNYFERILRNDRELEIVREYIRSNPIRPERGLPFPKYRK